MAEYPDAARLMAGPLGQWLHSQIAVREDARQRANNRVWKVAMVLLPAMAFAIILLPVEAIRVFQFGLFGGVAGWYWSQGPKREAVKQVKTGINEAIADALGMTYEHDVEHSHGFDRAESFSMMPNHDRSSFEDLWSGTYAGHPFALHEAHLEERR